MLLKYSLTTIKEPALNGALDMILVHDCLVRALVMALTFYCGIPMGHFKLWAHGVPQILKS